jgi:hypothetical protein
MTIARAEALIVSETNSIKESCAKMRSSVNTIYKQLENQRGIVKRQWNRIESTQSEVRRLIDVTAETGIEIERELVKMATLRDALSSAKGKVNFLPHSY